MTTFNLSPIKTASTFIGLSVFMDISSKPFKNLFKNTTSIIHHKQNAYKNIKYLLTFWGLFCGLFCLKAQTPKPVPFTPIKKIITLADANFKKTDLYIKRNILLGKAFASTTQKTITYADGSNLNLKLVINPSFGGRGSSITATPSSTTVPNTRPNCTPSSLHLTANSTSFLNSDYVASAGRLFPGAVYTFDNFFNGSYRQQLGARYPLTLVTDNQNAAKPYITVPNPDMATIVGAVDVLASEDKTPATNSAFTYKIYETGSNAAQSLQISGGISGYGASVSASHTNSDSSTTVNVTIDAKKILYTIGTAPSDSGFFLSPAIESTPKLMVIGSVSYGIRVLANLSYTFNSAGAADTFKASYSGWGVSGQASLSEISKNSSVSSTINCYVIGGPGNSTLSFDKNSLETEITNIFKAATNQNAKPVEYSLFDMAGNLIGSESATDDFTVNNCIPDPKLESAFVKFTCGDDGKNASTHYNMNLFTGNAVDIDNYNTGGFGYVGQYTTYLSPEKHIKTAYNAGSNPIEQIRIDPRGISTNQLTKNYFSKYGGGVVHLNISPDGNDTWKINQMILHLNFLDRSRIEVTFPRFSLSEDRRETTLYFDGDFKPR